MATTYWNQWVHSELMSMHGVELDDFYADDLHDMHDQREQEEEEHCCSFCMDCLGLSWRDFI